ncbi:MAG: oligosaccharide flippase family protein [Clostridium sp.]|uniref:lipopolysaccharide biosynthesis protein n=1 Tax=Clostridium sp. TaxID=1506 RepID=UPI0025C4ED95|nr:oligosaccharide flippase family protein [Clostridium sp.]MCF0149550.1 oligosaccharide flippase family protein [Clostridium sp.]
MRTKKAAINGLIGILTYLISFLPAMIVRKIFLTHLGDELLGLSSLYTNIISYLSIIEMGIGSAIIFSLYKPFAEDDRVKVKGYIDYYAKFYKIVGSIILVLGIVILPFLHIFIKDNIDMTKASIYFVLFLINTVISYWFSYKLCILSVAQEGYIVSIGTAISKVIIAILQVIILKLYSSFFLYITIQIIVNLLYYLVLNRYIDKKYGWLNTTNGEIETEEKHNLIKNVKALFMHKIGYVVVFGTDNLVISSFINLSSVAKYNSYNMIIAAIQGVINTAMAAITPSIGNLLVDNDKEKSISIHKKLFFMNFWIVSFVTISLYNTISQFINVWLGKEQLLDSFTVNIILVNLYFQLMRSSVEQFKEGSGNYYQDRYASFIEAFINLAFSIILVKQIGIAGVFIGTLISNIAVIFWVKPMITYKYVFNEPLRNYFYMYFKYLVIAIIPLLITHVLTRDIKQSVLLSDFILNCTINILVINLFYLIIFRKNKEFIYFKNLIKVKFKR